MSTRAIPPIPDRWPTLPLNPERATDRAFLQNIQGNILNGHGRRESRLVYFRFKNLKNRARHREFLKASVESGWVTSAWMQREQSVRAKVNTGSGNEVFASLFLTRHGLKALGNFERKTGWVFPADEFLTDHPQEFGRSKQELAGVSRDRFYRVNRAGMWILACACTERLDEAVSRLRDWCAGYDVAVASRVDEGTTWMVDGKAREPFGFVDGISGTNFFAATQPGSARPAGAILEDALITRAQSRIHECGSFLVFRKIEQDVQKFRDFEARLVAAVGRVKGLSSLKDEIAPALIIGRTRDGRPLTDVLGGHRLSPGQFDDFDFVGDSGATGCPFHAHIRRMNPRASVQGQGFSKDTIARNLPIRRSATYDPKKLLQRSVGEGSRAWPSSGVGLLFMAYVNNIERQFEVPTETWAGSSSFPGPHMMKFDPMIGVPPDHSGPVTTGEPWTWRGETMPTPPSFVRTLGAEYFYVPSIRWLLARGVSVALRT